MGIPFETDVLIVGGGPAGTSTALSLLKYSNLKVTIIEQNALDTVRVGEQINSSLFELLDYIGIKKSDFENNSFIPGYSSLAAWGSSRITSRDSIFSTQAESFQLDREQFDLLLLEQASQKGALILPRTKCTDFRQTETNWVIDLKHETKGDFTANAKYLIDATGRQSNVCRKLGLSSAKKDDLVAVGVFLHFEDSNILKQDILIETIEEGWWYCATLPNQQMTVTLFTDTHIVKEKKLKKIENWNKLLLDTVHIKNKIKNASSLENFWVKNAFSQVTDSTSISNFLAVGDAAASFDPISSMGIGFAISSACHAAKAIIDYENKNQSSISNYQQNVNAIFNNYLTIKTQFYDKEKRWQDAPFWKKRIVNQNIIV
jgi:flavin-dependent dehydrogenase